MNFLGTILKVITIGHPKRIFPLSSLLAASNLSLVVLTVTVALKSISDSWKIWIRRTLFSILHIRIEILDPYKEILLIRRWLIHLCILSNCIRNQWNFTFFFFHPNNLWLFNNRSNLRNLTFFISNLSSCSWNSSSGFTQIFFLTLDKICSPLNHRLSFKSMAMIQPLCSSWASLTRIESRYRLNPKTVAS